MRCASLLSLSCITVLLRFAYVLPSLRAEFVGGDIGIGRVGGEQCNKDRAWRWQRDTA